MPFPSTIVNTGSELMDGTEKVIFDISSSVVKHYQIYIYLDPASGGSESFTAKLEIRRYTDDVYFQIESVTKTGADLNRVIEFNFRSTKGIKCKLTQTGGTFRTMLWEVHSI